MIRVEATTKSNEHIPFSITWTGTDQISPEARTGLARHTAARELSLNGSQLVLGCVCFLGAANLLLWALLKLRLFELWCSTLQAFPIPRSDCFSCAPLLLSPHRLKLKAVWKGNSRCN